MQYHQPRQHHPGDAPPANPAAMAQPHVEVRPAWQVVAVRIMGEWRLAVLTEWRQPRGGPWVAHVRWALDRDQEVAWAWIVAEPPTLRPLGIGDVTLPGAAGD